MLAKSTYWRILFLFVFAFGIGNSAFNEILADQKRPNIVWIVVEDMSLPFGCYGEIAIQTPNIDQLAKEGVLFSHAFVTAPVCSSARSALITGMYQTSIGAHHHRSGRGTEKIDLPEKIRLLPDLFKQEGYYVTNARVVKNRKKLLTGKTDYNFEYPKTLYNGANWETRKAGQPFFAQYHLSGGKGRTDHAKHPVDPVAVKLPPYYPNDPVIQKDWAQYLNAAQNTDDEVGSIINKLKEAGELENTYLFFMTDHGISHVRGKQFMYDEGLQIPFIVRGPGLKPGTVRDDLIVHIDMAATSLELAGIELPGYLESRPLFGPKAKPREYVVSARDRCDETVDHMRSVRTKKFKYIKNYLPNRPYLQPCAYKDKKEIVKAMRRLHAEGKLNRDQSLIMADKRPAEELYDLETDPFELHNLAGDRNYQQKLSQLRSTLNLWVKETNDKGMQPESEKMYDSDMKVYVDNFLRRSNKTGDDKERYAKVIKKNVAIMKKWQAEGR